MTDLLGQKLPVVKRNRNRKRRRVVNPEVAPLTLDKPKAIFVAIRSMVADDFVTANLPRAVVQFLRSCEAERSEIGAGEFEEPDHDWNIELADAWMVFRSRERRQIRCQSFLDNARRLDQISQPDSALDIIFDQIDEMLLAGQFDRIDELLIETATDDYSVEVLLGILPATLPAKDRLPSRDAFFERVTQTLQTRGELKDGLLVGLD